MKESVLKLLPAIFGIAAGAVLAMLDPHIILILFIAHALGIISGICLGRFSSVALFALGLGLGMIVLFTHLIGSALGSGGGIIGFGLGCLYGLPAGILALLGGAIGHLAATRGLTSSDD
jgi:hypothetical protein